MLQIFKSNEHYDGFDFGLLVPGPMPEKTADPILRPISRMQQNHAMPIVLPVLKELFQFKFKLYRRGPDWPDGPPAGTDRLAPNLDFGFWIFVSVVAR